MAKKIIGLSCGRKNGNSENFLKTALMEAEKMGVQSEIVRVNELRVLPCSACGGCGATGKCPKDDTDWILENTLLANRDTGIIVSAPVYHVRTNGYLLCISEKMNHLFRRDPDLFKRKKMGAAISVGGSGYDGWTSLGLPTMNLFLQHFCILVDQIQINHCNAKGGALTPDNQWAIDRCKQLGRNIVNALNTPAEQVSYMGEDTPVSCPVCHCNILYIEKDFPEIACPVCQVHGTVNYIDYKYKVSWNTEDAKHPRFSEANELHHAEWMKRHADEERPQISLAETQEKIRMYDDYGKFIRPEKAGIESK